MRTKRSIISVALALAMVLSCAVSLFAVSADYALVEHKDAAYDIDDGARYTEYDLTSYVNGNTEVANMITFSSADYIPMVFTCYAGSATNLMNQYNCAVNKYQYDVIGAMNGSFFDMSNGMLIGINISNGKITCAHAGYSDEVVAFSSDGSMNIVKSTISYTLSINGKVVPNGIYYINKTPGKNGTFGDRFYYFDASCGSKCDTYETTPGYEVVCKKVNNTELVVGGTLVGEVLEVRTDSYGYQLADDYNTVSDKFVLFVKNGSSYADYVKDLEAGAKVEINAAETVAASREIMENASSVITNVGWLVKDGVDQTALYSTIGTHSVTYKARWNAFGVKADGTYVFFTVEGGGSGVSNRSVTLKDVAKTMMDAGCVNVIRMDGGGSVGLYVKDDGTGAPGYKTSSSRGISDCILIVKRPQPSDDIVAALDELIGQAEAALGGGEDPELQEVYDKALAVRNATTSTSGDYIREIMNITAFFSGGAVLADAITQAKGINYEDYSEEQLDIISEAYDYALAVMDTPDATPSAIKEAAERLLDALKCNNVNLALDGEVRIVGGKLEGPPEDAYKPSGTGITYNAKLNDGVVFENASYKDGDWFAFYTNSSANDNSVPGVTIDGVTYNVGTAVIDLKEAKTWGKVRVYTWAANVSGIAAPSRMIISSSDDGAEWTTVGDLTLGTPGSIYWAENDFSKVTSRYVRLQTCWKPGTGVFTFVNEIEIYEAFDKVSNVGWVNGFNQKISAGTAYIFDSETTPDLTYDAANVRWSQTLYLTWDADKEGFKVTKKKSPDGADGGKLAEGMLAIGVHSNEAAGDPSVANRAYAAGAKVGDFIEFHNIYVDIKDVYPGGHFKIVSASDFNKDYNGIHTPGEYDIPTSTIKPLKGTVNLVPDQVYEKIAGNGVNPVYSFDENGVMTVATESGGGWPCVHTDYEKPLMFEFDKAEIDMDFTVGSGGETSILLYVNDGQYIKLSQNVGGQLGAGNGDLYSGTYTVRCKLSEIKAYDQENEAANHYQGQVELLPDEDGNITFTGITIYATNNTTVTIRSIKIIVPDDVPPEDPGIRGDLNEDGKVSSNDAILLLRHILFEEDYPLDESLDLDFNGDGSLDSNDAIYLLRHVLFGDEYPL
ncbi:MAG: phosphodiester glycosidase family protein [Clostridia bacterium]|nr:phosphodiester glycosidase family protein [Clostridia bacterium]